MTAVHQEHGHIVSLMPKVQGDQLAVAASIGATTLTVGDVADFDEGGGSVQIAGVVYGYSGVDDETSQVFLTSGLSAAAAVDEPVQIWDDEAEAVVTEYVALVMLDYMTSGDPLEAGVAHELIDLLAEDTRAARGESVTVEWSDDDDLTVVAVHGKVAVPQVATAALVEAGDAYAVANDAAAAAADAAANATTAQTTADGKNTVTYSLSTPGSTANAAGDIWFQKESATQTVIGQWQGLGGTSWQQVTLNSQVIANLDAGKLTAGSAFTNALSVKTNFTLGDATTNGVIQSYDFAGSSVGIFIDKNGMVSKGGTFTGGLFQTDSGATVGTKMIASGPDAGLVGYDGTGRTFWVKASNGSCEVHSLYVDTDGACDIGSGATISNGLQVMSGGVDVLGAVTSYTASIDGVVHGGSFYADGSAGGGTTGASLDDNGRLHRTVSSRRYKDNIVTLDDDAIDRLLDVRVVTFTRKDEARPEPLVYMGAIAEEVAELGLDPLVFHNAEGQVDGIHYDGLAAAALAVAQRQQQQIADLSTQLAALADRVAALEGTTP